MAVVQARLVQLMQKLSPDHFDWATSIVLGRYPGAVQVLNHTYIVLCLLSVPDQELLQAYMFISGGTTSNGNVTS